MNQELFPSLPAKPKKARKPRDPNAPKKPRALSTSQQIIIKHVSNMRGNYNPADWGREGRICATLSKKYGAEFLLWASPPEGYKVGSLTFYYSVLGRNYLSDQLVAYAKYKGVGQQEKQEIVLTEHKIGEDTTTDFKPKTLKEFLNYGKTIRQLNPDA